MIDPASISQTPYQAQPRPRPVFAMVQNDRMAGSVPAWVRPDTAQEQALVRLGDGPSASFQDDLNALNYRTAGHEKNINQEPFGFGDLIDIINPLQHIPIVGTLYRELTGDQIRSSSSIVGGAIYGGGVGAASGLVNLVIEEETGKPIEGHVMAAVFPEPGAAEKTLARLAATGEPVALPGTVMAFADMGYREPEPEPAQKPRISYTYRFNE